MYSLNVYEIKTKILYERKSIVCFAVSIIPGKSCWEESMLPLVRKNLSLGWTPSAFWQREKMAASREWALCGWAERSSH
jgi:hypothetical protein